MNKDSELKKFIKGLLKMNFITAEEFAEKLGCTRTLIFAYYNDQRRPSVAMILKMSEILQCSPKELLQYVKPRKKFYGQHVW